MQARLSGRVPTIMNEDKQPARRAPGAFARRARFTYVVPIMSGKGGVGKSLTTALLAVGLRRAHKKVGILDADITGPSIPRLFGLTQPLGLESDPSTPPGQQPKPLMVPAMSRSAIEIVSSNLLTDKEDTAMIWRGPILSGVIRQFYEQALWSDLDYLLIDLPPGTSDAPLTVLQSLAVDGIVLVTMPQRLATMIVRKAANLVHQLGKPIVGVVENMSYFVAPDTGKRYDVFGPSYADQVAELADGCIDAPSPRSSSSATGTYCYLVAELLDRLEAAPGELVVVAHVDEREPGPRVLQVGVGEVAQIDRAIVVERGRIVHVLELHAVLVAADVAQAPVIHPLRPVLGVPDDLVDEVAQVADEVEPLVGRGASSSKIIRR